MTGGEHIPVMKNEVLAALALRDGGSYVDATFGAGGYASAMLEDCDCSVYGFDRDPAAIEKAKAVGDRFPGRLFFFNRPFSEMEDALAGKDVSLVDGVVFDLGVSSMQLDNPDRGFSFRFAGRLSMRMDGGKPDAGDVIARANASELASIFKIYGEEKYSRPIARAIVESRARAPIETTDELASIVARAAPQRANSRIHPATRVFQALRIFVNDELGQLIAGLRAAERLLRPAGRLVAVTFHSLEDRIVKRFFSSRSSSRPSASRHAPPGHEIRPSFEAIYRKPLLPNKDEVDLNPRARSAKLRAGSRLDAPAIATEPEFRSPRGITLHSFEERI